MTLFIADDYYDVTLRVPTVAGAIMTKIAAAIDPRTSDGERHIQDVAFFSASHSTSQPSPATLNRATASNSKRCARRLRTRRT